MDVLLKPSPKVDQTRGEARVEAAPALKPVAKGKKSRNESYFDDDDDEEFPQLPLPSSLKAAAPKEEEEEVDELDAFMAGLEKTVIFLFR